MNLSRALVVPLIFVCLSTLRPIAWGEAAKPEDLVTLPGFKVELLRTADPATEGSWISIAKDPQGRLLLGAEKTEPITRVTIKDGQVANAEILKIPLSEVMGMLFAFDSLYINGRGIAPDGKDTFGLWRCRSTNNDGNYDKVEFLREWKNGGGDHGAHAILEHPDGKHLTILCGNFCETPADVSPDSPHRNYADDVVLPRAEDSNGFGAGHRGPASAIPTMWLTITTASCLASTATWRMTGACRGIARSAFSTPRAVRILDSAKAPRNGPSITTIACLPR
jgi:hypothetical protein